MNAIVKDNTAAHAWDGKLYSDGWREPGGGTAPVLEPATGQVLARAGVGSTEDVARAVASAAAAQPAWAAMPFNRRAAIMREAARLLRERAAEFNYWNIRECGSIPAKAEFELDASCEQLDMAAALPMQPDGLLFPSAMPGRRNQWRQVPIGVVGVIAPWNFPLLLALRSVAPALALGNAVVLKPDQQSAVCGGLLLAQLFEDAGLPPGVLHVLPGGAETGDALVRHPDSGMISFTGSTAVGRAIGQICGQMLKKVALELGGNNAIIVLDDADIDAASSSGAWGAFLHQGQICMQAGRHLVHRSVAERYAEKLAERAARLVVGDPHAGPVHLGPLINGRQCERIHRIVQDSVRAGATLLSGGTHEGLFYRPTVLAGVTSAMPAFSEEIFGPVAPITVFGDDDEAVALANSSAYGLAAAIHSRSVARAGALAQRLRSGMVHINDQTVNNEFQVPFGGMGASGNGGRFGGPANAHEFTQSQWISVLDQPIAYPF
ncbi:benzaldehyde dehydrogenase [Pseudoduganella namucuonensis]|uniref:Benzaldehyde dehydrogenase (NAD+) n=1 Tax=Pseudoduganella namucuonensis TaxID=1035707 RepID=A0A1I7L723_9BURK|nr:benzaldehyde dehydrogenase [Pseudoduganella namucuonensis]SFV05521.1 benzaldehyde dehydrogenase (NAD+) [Pseudoduganella namucuonensis]